MLKAISTNQVDCVFSEALNKLESLERYFRDSKLLFLALTLKSSSSYGLISILDELSIESKLKNILWHSDLQERTDRVYQQLYEIVSLLKVSLFVQTL